LTKKRNIENYAERKEDVNGMLLLITWVWQDGGISSRGQYLCIFAAVARVESVVEAATSPSPIPLVAI